MKWKQAPIALRVRKNQNWSPWRLKPTDLQNHQSPRERLHIQIQVYLQRRQSVLIKTPRWSEEPTFWQRAFGEKTSVLHLVPPPPHLSLSLQWRQLLEQLGFIVHDDKTLKVVAERSGFREALLGAIESTEKPILITQAERWPLTMLSDLQYAWTKSSHIQRPALFLGGAVRGGEVDHQLWLPDLSQNESLQQLGVEQLGAKDLDRLLVYIRRAGGIPAFIRALKPLVEQKSLSKSSVEQVWKPLLDEIQQIVDHLSTDMKPYMRLCSIVQSGARPFVYGIDQSLVETGLVRKIRRGVKAFVVLRAPIFARCIHSTSN
ncbi:MAG: hypothetical protein ACON4U_21510 [Myxococcota bacterium]